MTQITNRDKVPLTLFGGFKLK